MGFARRIGVFGVAFSLVFVAAGESAAAPKPISGKLSKPGYTVIALAVNGKARTAQATRGKFRLIPPARSVTLHLRTRNGAYAGPIVVGREKRGRRAIVGIRAGARLGKIKVRRGYARVLTRLRPDVRDASFQARARRGVPIGARVFGRVRSRPGRRSVPGDRDFDGIPDPLDIDDDGDLALDNLDRSTAARASQNPNEFNIFSNLGLPIPDTANASLPGSTDEQIDATLPRSGLLIMNILPGDSAELDCAGDPLADPPRPGLVYCSPGGTGSLHRPGIQGFASQPFPGEPFGEFDPDGDGFGSLTPTQGLPASYFFLSHGATSDRIRTGQMLVQRVTTGGVESIFVSTLQYVFATVPALVSYSDTAGNSAIVSYPVANQHADAFSVAAGPDGNVVLTLTFWRPQRRPIPGEPGYGVPGAWTDIGGLTYTAVVQEIGDLGNPPGRRHIGKACPQGAFSSTDPLAPASFQLPVDSGPDGAGGMTDQTPDRLADSGNTFTYTLNVSQCLASLGTSWKEHEGVDFSFNAMTSTPDNAGQGVTFVLW